MLSKLKKSPCWLYDRLRWDVAYRVGQYIKGRRRYDFDGLFRLLEDLTGTPAAELVGYYAELFDEGVFDDVAVAIRNIPDMTPEHADLRYLGPEKYFRLDRSILYCLVRALRPTVFVETGTRFGISSTFIARALERNGSGHLWTFDIGLIGAKCGYFWPNSQTQIGFLIPGRLRKRITIVEGDALQVLPSTLAEIAPVDIYYFDSCQTYEHMTQEYELVYPHMRKGGLFMSEDIGDNAAWPEFLKQHGYDRFMSYCSHYGISSEREVGAIVVR